MTAQEFIKSRPDLVWYTKNYDNLNDSAIVEAVLSYGDWDDVQKLIQILGMERISTIFREQTDSSKLRCNYSPKTKNYFTHYFNKYA